MKVLITESKRDRLVIKWLNDKYGDLTPYEMDDYPNYIFFMKDDESIFDYNKKYGYVFISDDHIMSMLKSFFGLEYEEIRDIMKQWVEEHYKLYVTATTEKVNKKFSLVKEHYNLR